MDNSSELDVGPVLNVPVHLLFQTRSLHFRVYNLTGRKFNSIHTIEWRSCNRSNSVFYGYRRLTQMKPRDGWRTSRL